MAGITHCKILATTLILGLMMVPANSQSRVNSLRGGVGVSLDYDDRTYDRESPESRSNDDDYQRLVFTPMVNFTSSSERDNFLLSAAPNINYDLENYETDWDNRFFVSADRYITQFWELGISNNFIRSDYSNSDTGPTAEPVDPLQEVAPSTDPELSTDLGRRRYWRNTLDLFSDYVYREDSLFRLDFSYIALRNEDSDVSGYEEYDRYNFRIFEEHRFNPIWASTLDLQFIRGDFEETDPEVVDAVVEELAPGANLNPTGEGLSNDIKEYRLRLGVSNDSIVHNPLSVYYDYVGTRYDENLLNDRNVHQMRFDWRRDFSPHMYMTLGGGPSYAEVEGRDDTWGGNGIAQLNYRVERGYYNFRVDKRYDIENFSGNSEQNGLNDIWDTTFSFGYQLQEALTLTGSLGYRYEDREDLAEDVETVLGADEPLLVLANADLFPVETYHIDRYQARVGLNYSFWRFYNASIAYTFTKRESDYVDDDYDDHRVLMTLSWSKELSRW